MTKKPTVGLIHYTYPPVIGGVEKIVFDHAQLFAKYNFETNVYVGEGQNDNSKIKLHILPEFRSLGVTNPALREQIIKNSELPPAFYELSDKILQKIEILFESIDIFFIHNVLTFTFNPCLNEALIRYINAHKEKKFVIWVHDVILDPMQKKKTFTNKKVEKLFYQPIQGAYYVGISQFLKKTLVEEIGFSQNLVRVIPNGVDINNLLNLHSLSQEIISKYEVLNREGLIFLPTKIMRHKNIDLCLRIVAELKKYKKNPLLIITAKNFPHSQNTSYLDEIDSLIQKLDLKKNILLLHNEISPTQTQIEFKIVDDFYRLSDIVFFLSSFENFGLPLIEAGITKTPILLNNLEVFKEIESKNVYYVDIENENEQIIAKKVLNILEDDMRISFFRKIKKEYNFDYLFQTKLIPLIEKIWQK